MPPQQSSQEEAVRTWVRRYERVANPVLEWRALGGRLPENVGVAEVHLPSSRYISSQCSLRSMQPQGDAALGRCRLRPAGHRPGRRLGGSPGSSRRPALLPCRAIRHRKRDVMLCHRHRPPALHRVACRKRDWSSAQDAERISFMGRCLNLAGVPHSASFAWGRIGEWSRRRIIQRLRVAHASTTPCRDDRTSQDGNNGLGNP